MKKTLNFCFGRQPKLNNYFFLEYLSWGQMSLHTKFHHPRSCSFGDSYEEDFGFVFWKTTKLGLCPFLFSLERAEQLINILFRRNRSDNIGKDIYKKCLAFESCRGLPTRQIVIKRKNFILSLSVVSYRGSKIVMFGMLEYEKEKIINIDLRPTAFLVLHTNH